MTQICAKSMIEAVGKMPEYRPQIVNISVSATLIETGRILYFRYRLSMVTLLFADRLAEYGINVYEITDQGTNRHDFESKGKR